MTEWSSSSESATAEAQQVPSTASSTAPRSRYLTRSATRKGTTNISHILLEQRPATVRATKSSSTSLARNVGGSRARKPFIEALNRAAGHDDKEDNNGSATVHQENKETKAACSPAKPLPADRKRRNSAFTSSPRGAENSPNTRPRKVARMPQLSAIRLSPLKPLTARPIIRSDASSLADLPKIEASSSTNDSSSGSATISGPLFSVEQPTPSFKIESPAKVPVGSSTPFRYGTNRILDVPLSAVKKGARWSLASDLSDDSLLLQASPKKTTATEQDRLLSTDSESTSGARLTGGKQRLFPLDFGENEDLELGFLEESKDGIQVDMEDRAERQNATTNISNNLLLTTSKVSLDRQRKSALQKTSAARIAQRAQKSLALPRTTSSYAKPTQSSAKAASITAANITARTALENVMRRPTGKSHSTPVAEVAASSSTIPFSRPCRTQPRVSGISYSGNATLIGSSTSPAVASPSKPFAKPAARLPTSMEHRSPQKSLPHTSRPAPPSTYTTLQPVPTTSAPNHARRKSLTMETSKSLYGLSAAMAKLKVKRPSLEGKSPDTSISSDTTLVKEVEGGGRSTTPDARAGTKPVGPAADATTRKPTQPITIGHIPKSISIQGQNSLTRLAEVNRRISGEMQQPAQDEGQVRLGATLQASSLKSMIPRGIFHGVTVFVDVRTAEGDDSSAVFVEMLRAGGARVLNKPTDNCTHVVFKSGKASTLIWWRKQPIPKPHIVGIGWVTRSTELGRRAEEETFQVDVTAQAVFQKRRKSMEPRQLQALMGTSVGSIGESSGLGTSVGNGGEGHRMSMHHICE